MTGPALLKATVPSLRAPGRLERWCRGQVLRSLEGLATGSLEIIEGGASVVLGSRNGSGPHARISVQDPAFWAGVALGGSIGAGESWMDGHWESDDLVEVIRLLVLNREVLDGMETGWAWLTEPARQWFHRRHRNSVSGSRRNISDHYDLGNDLFRLFLDDNLMYSSAIFERPGMSLDEASRAKVDRLCRKLRLDETHHVLEIGTGWGGFALHAAREYGCLVTTTTISREQREMALQRVREAGLEDRITILDSDYRDLEGQYDRIVSIEMIEAVGHEFYDTYFATCSRLLKPDGMAAVQAITIADSIYERAKRSVDFIQRYIFPGSCIPSVGAMTASVAKVTDLRLTHLEDIGPHYAETLRLWRERFTARADDVRALGYPERFLRMWVFYLAYCEGGFRERSIGTVQMVLEKPLARHEPLLGTL